MFKVKQVVNTGLFIVFPSAVYWLPLSWGLIFVLVFSAKYYLNLDDFLALAAYLFLTSLPAKILGVKRPYYFIAELRDGDETKIKLRYHKQNVTGHLKDIKVTGDEMVHRIAGRQGERTVTVDCDEIGKDLCMAISDLLGNLAAADLEGFSKEIQNQGVKTKFRINTNERSQLTQLYLGSQPSFQAVLVKLGILNVVLAAVLFFL